MYPAYVEYMSRYDDRDVLFLAAWKTNIKGENKIIVCEPLEKCSYSKISGKIINPKYAVYKPSAVRIIDIVNRDDVYKKPDMAVYDKKYSINDIIEYKISACKSYEAIFYIFGEPANGIYKMWYDSGQQYIHTNYINKKLAGIAEKWHPNGKKHKKVDFKDGHVRNYFKMWYDCGQMSMEIIYEDKEIDGKSEHVGRAKAWHRNGKLLCVATVILDEYQVNKIYGDYKIYYYSGKLKEKGTRIKTDTYQWSTINKVQCGTYGIIKEFGCHPVICENPFNFNVTF